MPVPSSPAAPVPTPGPGRVLFFAVPEEARPFEREWRRDGAGRATGRGRGMLHTVVTGMGAENAARAARAQLDRHRPRWVITSGFAGGLDPALAVGQVVFEADGEFPLTPALRRAGGRPGVLVQTARVAVTAGEKRALRVATGADAVEMESSAIRAVCREAGIPAATVRVISDAAHHDLPLDFNALMGPGHRLRMDRLILRVLSSPRLVPRLLRFQRQVGGAAGGLARLLTRVLAEED